MFASQEAKDSPKSKTSQKKKRKSKCFPLFSVLLHTAAYVTAVIEYYNMFLVPMDNPYSLLFACTVLLESFFLVKRLIYICHRQF